MVIKFPKPFLAVQVDCAEIVLMVRPVTGVELVKFPNRTKGSWDEWPAPLRLYLAFLALGIWRSSRRNWNAIMQPKFRRLAATHLTE